MSQEAPLAPRRPAVSPASIVLRLGVTLRGEHRSPLVPASSGLAQTALKPCPATRFARARIRPCHDPAMMLSLGVVAGRAAPHGAVTREGQDETPETGGGTDGG